VKYFVIGDEDAVLGFGLVGVAGRVVRNAGEAEAAFEEALSDAGNGIVIVVDRVAELIRAQVDAYMFSERFPLVVEVPGRRGRLEGRPALRDMITAAIGIKL